MSAEPTPADPNAIGGPVANPMISQIKQEQTQDFTNNLRAADRWVANLFGPAADAGATAVGPGQGFSFTPEQLANLIIRAEDQQHQLEQNIQKIQPFIRGHLEPAPDQAGSVMQATAVSRSFEYLGARMRSQRQYLQAWIGALTQAKQNYLNQEHLTEEQWSRLTKGLQA